MNKKFEYECEIAKRFLDVRGISYADLTDPLEAFKRETGADVLALLSSGKKIGIQVTVPHSDVDSTKNGSRIREQEEKNKRMGKTQPYAVPVDYRPTLQKSLEDKVSNAQKYNFDEFDEVWLLLAASLPQYGAVASTTFLSVLIKTENLSADFHGLLSQSKYSAVFLYIFNERAIFQWTRQTQWQIVKNSCANYESGFDNYRRLQNDPEFVKDPRAWCKREALKVWREFRDGKSC